MYHSHTNPTSPSRDDLKFLTNPNVEEVGVISINGDVYIISRGNGELVSEEVFKEEVAQISSEVDLDIINYDDFYSWTTTQRNYMGIREQFFRICRRFGWTMKGGKL